jgi:hypothetical protein
MSKVYIVQNTYVRDGTGGTLRPKYDLRGVNAFGQPVEILHGLLSPLATAPAMAELRHALRGYSDDDYLLAIGAGAFLIAAGAIAAQHNNGRVHVLYWNGDAQKYFPLTFDVNHSQHKEPQHAT